MPELPEVETVKNELLPYVIGRRICGVDLTWEGIVKNPSPEEFRNHIVGQTITGITRLGKYLIFNLSGSRVMVIHLRMTGSLIIGHNSTEPPRFTRAVIHLEDNISVFFRDPRKFGMMRLENNTDFIIAKLGPEPLEDSFTVEVLTECLSGRKAPIKALLFDQAFVAGIGNMYADEALFAAKIHPMRFGGSLSVDEITRLHREIKRILRAAIGSKGASVENYIRPDGSLGTAHFQFKVAHRLGGEFCANCGTAVERITVRNRGTYFCPVCQPELK
ncbi:bifunctional DNA-formamidopyrimidine glycosylase/DNA-(apurinic or apyrimidinic site) lyase [Chloroflexota bacterium]